MDLVEELKKHKPVSLRVELDDGTLRTVPMPKAGARWSKAVKVLDALPWVKVECLDGKGGIVGVIEADEEDEPEPELGGTSEATALAKVMLAVMQTTMSEVRKMFGDQLKGMADMQRAQSEAMTSLSETYQHAMRVQASTVVPTAGEQDEVVNMMKMAMMMGMQRPKPVGGEGG
jgi:hypothetical protein